MLRRQSASRLPSLAFLLFCLSLRSSRARCLVVGYDPDPKVGTQKPKKPRLGPSQSGTGQSRTSGWVGEKKKAKKESEHTLFRSFAEKQQRRMRSSPCGYFPTHAAPSTPWFKVLLQRVSSPLLKSAKRHNVSGTRTHCNPLHTGLRRIRVCPNKTIFSNRTILPFRSGTPIPGATSILTPSVQIKKIVIAPSHHKSPLMTQV